MEFEYSDLLAQWTTRPRPDSSTGFPDWRLFLRSLCWRWEIRSVFCVEAEKADGPKKARSLNWTRHLLRDFLLDRIEGLFLVLKKIDSLRDGLINRGRPFFMLNMRLTGEIFWRTLAQTGAHVLAWYWLKTRSSFPSSAPTRWMPWMTIDWWNSFTWWNHDSSSKVCIQLAIFFTI